MLISSDGYSKGGVRRSLNGSFAKVSSSVNGVCDDVNTLSLRVQASRVSFNVSCENV